MKQSPKVRLKGKSGRRALRNLFSMASQDDSSYLSQTLFASTFNWTILWKSFSPGPHKLSQLLDMISMSISDALNHEKWMIRNKYQTHSLEDNSNGLRNMIKLQNFLGKLFERVGTESL